jgi:hypothetical protein
VGFRFVELLDMANYTKADALDTLKRECGWVYYGGKHYESVFTRFFQGYYLPVKFGYDKRRAHLASLINSGQMSREEALAELEHPTYGAAQQQEDKEFVAKKLGLKPQELDAIFALPNRHYSEYKSNDWLLKTALRLKRKVIGV